MNLTDRIKVIHALEEERITRKQFRTMCAKNPAFFIETCLWLFEPRADNNLRTMPFLLRKIQRQYVGIVTKHINDSKGLLTDKTREMGVTWIICALLLHRWIFEDRFTAILSSITEDKIDTRDSPDCLFWKLDFMIESLKWTVPWLVPEGYTDRQPTRTHMKVVNPVNGSILRGEVMGPNLGRSGRSNVIFMDEFAEAAAPAEAWAASSRTTNCRLPVFTPRGMNYAGMLAHPKKGQPRSIDRVSLHWMQDETKNRFEIHDRETDKVVLTGNGKPDPADVSRLAKAGIRISQPIYPWYEEAKLALNFDKVKIAQELDISYEESVDGIMYPQIRFSRMYDDDSVAYDPKQALYCSMDYGTSDMTALVWFQYDHKNRRFRIIDSYRNNGKTIKWYVPFMLGPAFTGLGEAEGGYSAEETDLIMNHAKFFGRYTAFYGDPAGKQRNQVTNTSVIQELAKYDIFVKSSHKFNSYETRKFRSQRMLLYCDFNVNSCGQLIDDLKNSREEKGKPVHGPESHFRTAFEYGAVHHMHGTDGSEDTVDSEAMKQMVDMSPEALASISAAMKKSKKTVEAMIEGKLYIQEGNPYELMTRIKEDMARKQELEDRLARLRKGEPKDATMFSEYKRSRVGRKMRGSDHGAGLFISRR